MGRRTRAVAMLGAAAVCSGVAFTAVSRETDRVRSQVGGLVPAVVVTRAVPSGTRFTPASVAAHLAVRRVPERFVPPTALATVVDAVGLRLSAALAPGDYLTEALLRRSADRSQAPGRTGGGRLVEVEVAGASTIAPLLRPGSSVDVLITTQGAGGTPRTYLALQSIRLAAFAARSDVSPSSDVSGVASLHVSLREAVLLTAAQSFARELRLIPHPADDRGAQPRFQVRERDL